MGETARVQLVTDVDVIGAVQHQVMLRHLRGQRLVIQHRVNQGELNVGVDAHQRRAGRVHLRLANRRVAVQRLALEI